jgi:hypothetical protein
VDCALLRRTDAPAYQPDHALFRQMRHACRRPGWGQERVVTADAADASRAHGALLPMLGYREVMAWPRTWKFPHGQALNALVTQLPRGQYTPMRRPTGNTPRRRPLWVSAKRARLRHLGDGTVVRSQGQRHQGPKQTNILVTHLPETVPARHMGGVYWRRGWVELLVKALPGVVGMGHHQGTKHVARVGRSVAVAIMAYLLRLTLQATGLPADRPGSAFRLQRTVAWEGGQAQGERSARQLARKWLQVGHVA